VFVSQPPLYRVDVPARAKKPAQKIYCLDDGELKHTLDKLRKDGFTENAWSIGRFKGLGEMTAPQLWETTLNPDTRRLVAVSLGALSNIDTSKMFDMLMGKTEAAARKAWLEERGNEVEADI
jgi:topoisomerase IV subunit B